MRAWRCNPPSASLFGLAAKRGHNFRQRHCGRQRNERCRPVRERRFVRVDFDERDALVHRDINEPGGGIARKSHTSEKARSGVFWGAHAPPPRRNSLPPQSKKFAAARRCRRHARALPGNAVHLHRKVWDFRDRRHRLCRRPGGRWRSSR